MRLDRQRWRFLVHVEAALETPLSVLGFVWLGLLVLEFTGQRGAWLERSALAIWIIFVIDFAVRFVLAPKKVQYLRRNWLTIVALAIPAARALRFVRLLRLARGLRLVRLLTSLNRGLASLRRSTAGRGFGYVVTLTLLVTFAGAAGMYTFESNGYGTALSSYSEALWWTAMMMTTMGSEYWPKTVEGRVLCFLLSLYAFAVFGYVTASLASFFVGQDARRRARQERS